MRRFPSVLVVLLAALEVAPAGAQTISSRAADIRIGGRLHAQYSTSSVGAATEDFFLRRARVTADIGVTDLLDGRVQVEVARGRAAVQDAYFRLGFADGFRVSVGQFKRAFDIFELASSTDLSLIERDGRVEGVDACSGVGGICSYSRLTERLDYAARDVGVRVDGSSGRVSYLFTMTNGTGINVSDENDAKSYSGRLTLAATDDVRVSGQVGVHDYVEPDQENANAIAWGADVEVGTWRDGLLVQASLVRGDNWELLDAQEEAATFLAFQGTVSYYAPLAEGGRLHGVEPIVRLSHADPDTDVDDDGGLLFTPGLMLYVSGKNKVGVNVDIYSPQTGDTEWSLKVQSFLYF